MNYIQIENTKIELTQQQVETLKNELINSKQMLSTKEPGDTFKIGEYEFITLEHLTTGTAVILKDCLYDRKEFGTNNNYDGSYGDELCNDFANELSENLAEDALIEHDVDLTSDDGLKDYGVVKRKMSLITAEMYRKYVYIFDKHKIDKWWWLSTPWSVPTHGYDSTIKCVSPVGHLSYNYYSSYFGVRPFCILKSNIFVSK